MQEPAERRGDVPGEVRGAVVLLQLEVGLGQVVGVQLGTWSNVFVNIFCSMHTTINTHTAELERCDDLVECWIAFRISCYDAMLRTFTNIW